MYRTFNCQNIYSFSHSVINLSHPMFISQLQSTIYTKQNKKMSKHHLYKIEIKKKLLGTNLDTQPTHSIFLLNYETQFIQNRNKRMSKHNLYKIEIKDVFFLGTIQMHTTYTLHTHTIRTHKYAVSVSIHTQRRDWEVSPPVHTFHALHLHTPHTQGSLCTCQLKSIALPHACLGSQSHVCFLNYDNFWACIP